MWVRVEDGKVTYYGEDYPMGGGDVFEWFGERLLVDQEEIIDGEAGIFQPRIISLDPRPPGYTTHRVDFDDLVDQADSEIEWLNTTIPGISEMSAAELAAVLERLARENRQMLGAWRYVLKRLA